MPIQADPPFIDSAAAQAYRARLRAIYNAPSAIPAQRFNVQQPLPPVPYTNSPNFPSYLDAQIKANPAPQPPTRTAPPLPPSITHIIPPPTINPVPRIALPPGSGGAAVVTLTGGGVVSGAGLLTGGLSTLAGGLLIYNARELYKLFKLSQPEAVAPKSNLVGGQEDAFYLINGVTTEICSGYEDFRDGVEITWTFKDAGFHPGFNYPLRGPLILDTEIGKTRNASNSSVGYVAFKEGGEGYKAAHTYTSSIGHAPLLPEWRKITDISVRAKKVGNDPEPQPKLEPIKRRSPIKSGISPSSTPQGILNPNPTGVRSPTSPPPVTNPLPTNNRIPYTIVTPGSSPITITSPGANPVVITPAGSPATIKITRPSTSPFLSPTPVSTPTATPITTPTGTPTTTPSGVPIAVSSPGSAPTNLVMPGTNPITITYPGQKPIVIDPSTSKPPQGVQATPIPKPGAFITTPASPTQTPTNPVTTPTKPGTPTTPTIPGVKDPDLEDIGLKLVALTALIQDLNNNTTPQALQAAAAGTCQTTAPGGCTTAAINKGNQDLLDKLGIPAGQAADLLLLGKIDNKLGNQITGGLSGGLSRLSNFLGIDRVFNLINFMANLHNAFMLSNSLKITLLEMLSSVGNATGLLQTAENENVDLNEVYNKGVRALINSILGDEQAARLEIQFRRANRIYQAAANSTNAVSSMMSSLGNVVEVSAEYGGKIGNALKAAGAVHEKAYQWMAEKFDAKISPFIKYSQTVEGVNTALETINEIAESVVEGQQAATEFQKANTEFIKAVSDVQKNPGIENKAVAAEVAKQKQNATKDPTGENETGLLSFLTDL